MLNIEVYIFILYEYHNLKFKKKIKNFKMKKTYEMKININENDISNNMQNTEMYHKILEDPFIPTEVETYLNVQTLFYFYF